MRLKMAFDQMGLTKDEVINKIGLTERRYERITTDPAHIRSWMMEAIIRKYRINPLYVYGESNIMFLDPNQ